MSCDVSKLLDTDTRKELGTYLKQPEAMRMQGMVNEAVENAPAMQPPIQGIQDAV